MEILTFLTSLSQFFTVFNLDQSKTADRLKLTEIGVEGQNFQLSSLSLHSVDMA